VVVPDINLLVFAYNEAAPRHRVARTRSSMVHARARADADPAAARKGPGPSMNFATTELSTPGHT
jgi:hypothetical protein